MPQTLYTATDKALLTRAEVRKLFRVNEIAIDAWLGKGRLMQVGIIPDEADGQKEFPVFAVRDVELIQRLRDRVKERGAFELAVDRLARTAREELLRQAKARNYHGVIINYQIALRAAETAGYESELVPHAIFRIARSYQHMAFHNELRRDTSA